MIKQILAVLRVKVNDYAKRMHLQAECYGVVTGAQGHRPQKINLFLLRLPAVLQGSCTQLFTQ